ncbi:V-type proton ATPase 116 kDa subunit a1 [Labeo rohita]|uniref:V-type proton ATPase subunit a n=1 Tax=Labeo rohita TaxID=84645 RepID=A0ABQ8LEA6_LABRO|nr:V-type proton ATPase 116 kDa subunit a1 [Labeo rohita]
MKKRMRSFYQNVRKVIKRPLSETADPEPSAHIPHDSSGFESASHSITPDMSTTSSSLSEDSVDEREGTDCSCSMWANGRPSLQIANILTQDMSGQNSISSIPEYMYTLPGEVPVSVPSVILSAENGTNASPVENSTTGYLEKEMVKSNIVIAATKEKEMAPCPRDVLELESTFEKLEQELREINCNHAALRQNLIELMDIDSLLRMTEDFFEEAESLLTCSEVPSEDSVSMTVSSHITSRRNSNSSTTGALHLSFIAGVIKQERFPAFEKVLWRLFHGNFVLRHAEIQTTEELQAVRGVVKKDVFIIFVQGDHVREKIRKVCEGFRASLYSCPKTLYERKQMSNRIMTQMEDLRMILRRTEEYRAGVLTRAAEHVQEWGSKVKKMKAIYYTLNLCNIDITQKLIVAEIWCPVSDLNLVQNALIKGSEQSGSTVTPVLNRIQTQQTPPTFNRTNTFTEGFQTIIDAYGVGTYQEINPAPYTIVTFPFLFAVMFGDCGHGLVMTLFAVWVISQAETLRMLKNELTDVVVGGRYIILLMGMFSIYTGLIYNDCFSKSFNIFGSSWCVRPMFYPHGPWQNETLHEHHHLQLNPFVPGVYSGHPYVFGIDPLIFMLSLFGYLIFLILYKWCITLQSETAPSILLLFINMMLFDYQSGHKLLYGGQKAVQIFLVVTAVLMVPVLLLVKPFLIYRTRMKTRHQVFGNNLNDQHGTDTRASFSHHQKDEMVSMGDIFVYQAIHTIEYCLGCISNTASYLRLWALSLAHAELSEVLWRMVLQVGLKISSGMGSFLLVLLFAAFAVLTVTILLVMEGLSAFLHALRLHWVEFQNKFYEGSGYKFTPLSFDSLLKTQQ